jgi:hypothetical protein
MNKQNVSVLPENKQSSENVSVDNSWYARGERPPVGIECELWEFDEVWRKVEVIAHTKKGLVVYWENKEFLISSDRKFRPIKSERERFIDIGCCIILKKINSLPSEILGKLYDAGFRAPEELK